ncbi:VTT domain-containing protein [Cereibacter azotoformans]|uniref:Membrane protein DedA with SNARE-associated domain n=1 Tax=Cereibacter azotoformans TaxID=43057 RepID=A0A2T5K5T1_9RHOB|nr:VTT domain-containing protein [Cereibacter azotoformans]AXQ95585.1 hypothetical protein D0Z66_17610 [Cereibacter sphaeroides]PTR17773.1 membrane protein DedA with SNARE-associated domain [Cereibacter azotoformans]UIJ32168.1 VTT domain-containing protein [Cereibacter azotoformans]
MGGRKVIAQETVATLLAVHGLALIAPLALVEGPIVTVIAAWLAQRGVLDLTAVTLTVILADLVGDALLYAVGRRGGRPALSLLRVREAQIEDLAGGLRARAPAVLIGAKLTHAAGAAVLLAAGVARVPFGLFMACNAAATLPKSLFFVSLGWWFGATHARMGSWIAAGALTLTTLLVLLVLLYRRRSCS